MSYSFTVKKAKKVEALIQFKEEMDKVVAAQPIHAADAGQALSNASACVALLDDDDTRDVQIYANGSCWKEKEGHGMRQCSINSGATLVDRSPNDQFQKPVKV